MRLLVPATAASSVTLSPASGATGLWRAALRAEWDERREQDIERNRVQAGNCAMVDTQHGHSLDSEPRSHSHERSMGR